MAIQISSDGRTFTLQTEKSSYQMMADAHDVLLHLYYGRKIAAENLEERIFRSDVGFAGNPPEAGEDRTYSLDVLPQELPGSGVGDYREDMVRLYHADGSCAADFRFESYEVQEGAYRIPGLPAAYDTGEEKGETLVITMRETASAVKVSFITAYLKKKMSLRGQFALRIRERKQSYWIRRFPAMSISSLETGILFILKGAMQWSGFRSACRCGMQRWRSEVFAARPVISTIRQ